jgi:hypothetical protein
MRAMPDRNKSGTWLRHVVDDGSRPRRDGSTSNTTIIRHACEVHEQGQHVGDVVCRLSIYMITSFAVSITGWVRDGTPLYAR